MRHSITLSSLVIAAALAQAAAAQQSAPSASSAASSPPMATSAGNEIIEGTVAFFDKDSGALTVRGNDGRVTTVQIEASTPGFASLKDGDTIAVRLERPASPAGAGGAQPAAQGETAQSGERLRATIVESPTLPGWAAPSGTPAAGAAGGASATPSATGTVTGTGTGTVTGSGPAPASGAGGVSGTATGDTANAGAGGASGVSGAATDAAKGTGPRG